MQFDFTPKWSLPEIILLFDGPTLIYTTFDTIQAGLLVDSVLLAVNKWMTFPPQYNKHATAKLVTTIDA